MVETFVETVGLGMVCGTGGNLTSKETHDTLPKLWHELRVTVTHDLLRHTKHAYDPLKEHLGDILRTRCSVTWNQYNKLAEPINYSKNTIKASPRLGQLRYKIHSNLLPRVCRCRKRLQKTIWLLSTRLMSLAYRTLLTKLVNISSHGIPHKSRTYKL